MNNIAKFSSSFIKAYLNWIRHQASQISQEDRGIFPHYWFYPYQVIIHKNELDDIAIVLKRVVSGKKDKLSVKHRNCRIEETVLPNLDYTKKPMFAIANNVHDSVIAGVTLCSGSSPVLTIGLGSEIRIMGIRVEASAKGYPKEFELLWLFTFPNQHFFNSQKAEKDAQNDFWEGIRRTLYQQGENIFSPNFGKLTINVFLEYLEKVRDKLNKLITRQDIVEQDLQNFLEMHYFLLYEGIPIVKRTREIGFFRTDFTLELTSGKVMLVELQLNNDPLITNGKPSKGLREALMQIRNWFAWIEKNDSSNLYRYVGKIIIGRRLNYERNKTVVDDYVRKAKYPLYLSTYDDLNSNIDLLKQVMSSFKEKIGNNT